MTWSASLTVEDVGDGPAPIDILASADGDAVTSNTEGKVSNVQIRFQIDADETKIKIGDKIHASGSFDG